MTVTVGRSDSRNLVDCLKLNVEFNVVVRRDSNHVATTFRYVVAK